MSGPAAASSERDAPLDYDEDATRIYARFPRNYYGEPFVTRDLQGRSVLVIEIESGCPAVRVVSAAFYAAWRAEFIADGLEA